MALPPHRRGFEQEITIDANCGVDLQSRQNDNWIDMRRSDTNAWPYRRG